MAIYTAQAEVDGDRIRVEIPFRAVDLIKPIPGARAAKKNGTWSWHVPLTWNACVQLRSALGAGLEVGPELVAWSDAEWERRERILAARERALDPENEMPGNPYEGLRSYQQTAVAFLLHAGSAILGDEQGCGKTVEMLCALDALDKWPALVVCPRGVQGSWLADARRWLPHREHMLLEGSATQRRKTLAAYAELERPGVLIATYSQLPLHSRLAPYGSVRLSEAEKAEKELNALGFRVVAADEAHKAVHAKTKWTRALWWLGDRAEHRFAMTGTVTLNDVSDFWALLRFVAPDEWPAFSKHLDMYCDVSLNYWGGHEVLGIKPGREDEFRALVAPRFLRRPKALVLPYLPRKVKQHRAVDLPPKLRAAYKQMAKGMVAELEGQTIEAFDALGKWLRLSQFASAAMEEGEPDAAGMPTYRMCEPSPKLDELEEVFADFPEGTKFAVFANSRQLLDLAAARLNKRGTAYASIVGGMNAFSVTEAKEQFNRGEVGVLLISLGAGAEGLSLTGDVVEVFLDRSWSEAVNAQAEDRAHGIGRGNAEAEHLLIIDIIAADTVEQKRLEALADKRNQREEINQDTALLRRVFGG